MRVVFLNAWGGAVFDPLIEWLPQCRADVICLQEVTRTPGLGGWTRFEDDERVLPQRANLFEDVRAVLPDHQGSFVTNDAGPIADQAGREHRQDFGLATFVQQRLPIIGQEASFVYRSFVDHQRWAIAERPRMAQATRVLDRNRERALTIIHLHGLRDPAGKHDTPARQQQAERLAQLVDRVRAPGDLTLLGGDLNLLPDSETFDILGRIGVADLVGRADTRTSLYPKPLRHANYLFTSDAEQVDRFEIMMTPEVSDHAPLIIDC